MSLSHWTNISWVEIVNSKRQVNEITWSGCKKLCLPFALKMATGACLNKPTILDKSPWDSTAIFICFCQFSVPS